MLGTAAPGLARLVPPPCFSDRSSSAFVQVYFLQGMGGFALYTQKFYLIDDYKSTCPNTECLFTAAGCSDSDYPLDPKTGEIACHMGLGLQPKDQTAVRVFGSLPWNYKIYYGILSDCVPIFGSHRRSWIIVTALVGVLGFIGLGFMGDGGDDKSVAMVKWLILATNLSTAFCDVCTDALMTAYAKLQPASGAGDLQSLCWMAYGIGGILSNLFAANLYHGFAPSTMGPWFVCAVIPAFRILVAWRLNEPGPARRVALPEVISNAKKLVATLSHPTINRSIAFIFLVGALVPNLGDQQDNFLVTEDSHGFRAHYTTGVDASGADFGAANGTMDCAWFAENDPGCIGGWMDTLEVPPGSAGGQ